MGQDLPPDLGDDMALAACSAAILMAANTAAPGVGGIGAAALLAAVASQRQSRAEAKAEEMAEAEARSRVNLILAEEAVARRKEAGDGPAALWRDWLPWAELAAGQKIEAPRTLPHPKEAGFRYTRWGRGVGQKADWVHPLPDHSRLHAHEFADGRIVVHRDILDPGRGPGTATVHWLNECPEGNVLMGLIFAAQVGALAWVLAGATPRPLSQLVEANASTSGCSTPTA
jgi:hypothetical protein